MTHRLEVNINDECADALRRITTSADITTTEAIRRAIGLLDYFEAKRTTAAQSVMDLHRPYDLPDGQCVCGECSEPDDWDGGPYLHPTVHLVPWPCATVNAWLSQ